MDVQNDSKTHHQLSILNAYLDCIATLNSRTVAYDFYIEPIYKKGSLQNSLTEFFIKESIRHSELNHSPFSKLDFTYEPILDWKTQLNKSLNEWFFGDDFPISDYYEIVKKNIISKLIELLESISEYELKLYSLDNSSFDVCYLDYVVTYQDDYYYLHFSWND
ncbi:hypothetical protein E0H88_00950 [Acinetobacter sp. ANC 4216]|uniref:hypothetical protein n=1 Tax=Acinetobacter sp. ANC 4216 TaxID=2529840 RepID=UPI0010398C34|nr:hypothetical protein [Acinetobacter sp. ANC 4216]TCB72808.1 hypothetical protein E0H88_00950 [Acinetobacter sp. ANC 4216]